MSIHNFTCLSQYVISSIFDRKKMDDKSVKQRILSSRLAHKLSQQAMADRLGLSRNSYRAIEHGNTVLINSDLSKIADITGQTVEELVLGYIPVRDSFKEIQELRDDFELTRQRERSELLSQINSLQKEILGYQEAISSQKIAIKTLESHIKYLEKLLEND